TFGSLLRHHRLAAGLTQEALAERSGVSTRAIQHLEASGVRPRYATALQLIRALALPDTDRQALEDQAAPAHPDRVDRPRGRPRGVPRQAERRAILPLRQAEEPGRAHPLVALPRPAPTNLPWRVNSLIGRDDDVAAIRDRIARGGQRLI